METMYPQLIVLRHFELSRHTGVVLDETFTRRNPVTNSENTDQNNATSTNSGLPKLVTQFLRPHALE